MYITVNSALLCHKNTNQTTVPMSLSGRRLCLSRRKQHAETQQLNSSSSVKLIEGPVSSHLAGNRNTDSWHTWRLAHFTLHAVSRLSPAHFPLHILQWSQLSVSSVTQSVKHADAQLLFDSKGTNTHWVPLIMWCSVWKQSEVTAVI